MTSNYCKDLLRFNRSILGYDPNMTTSKQGWFYRTWRGEPGEEWSSAQGLESILISIQSLMSTNPYENEPGFETANNVEDRKNQKDYVAKVCLYLWLGLLKMLILVDTTRVTSHICHTKIRGLSWHIYFRIGSIIFPHKCKRQWWWVGVVRRRFRTLRAIQGSV